MPKKSAIFAILFVLGLVTASCGSGSGTSADSNGSGGEDTPGSLAADDGPVEFDGTIKIGAALSATGKFSVEGEDSKKGYDTWVEWVNNERGGVKVGDETYNVEVIYYDDESDVETAANLTTKLIDED